MLLTETYKVEIGIAPEKMKDILELENASYNLRSSCYQFRRKNIKTVHYGLPGSLSQITLNTVIL